ncbi:ATP-grasp domain-containing protein [Candidatus Parcubacteria bacterium]|nr:ATP-grasp domain-containing protein [Candidatus Parcubacteria bacterium]
MSRIKVAVLRGGPSSAYEESLKTGGYVLSLLQAMPEEYEPVDIFISKEGDWHRAGLVGEPHEVLGRADVVWNALHGEYGESGEAQRLLESLHVPFTGSAAMPSAFAHNKELAKALYRQHGIPTPESALVSEEDFSEERLVAIFRTCFHPVVVKPAMGVRGVGVRLAHTFQELKDAVKSAFAYGPKALVEEYVGGTVASASVIERAKGERLYALVPAHLETHYRRVRPRPEENRRMEEYARKAHDALGLSHYSSSDFVITPKGKIYILETNSQPLFHEDSLLHRSLEASGWKPKDYADHCLKLALER